MQGIGAFEAKNTLGALLDPGYSAAKRSLSPAMVSPWPSWPKLRENRPVSGAGCGRSHSGRGQCAEGQVRLECLESRPGCGPAIDLVLDGSATLAWVYSGETS